MDERRWMVAHKIASDLCEMAGLDEDAAMEITLGVMLLDRFPEADTLHQVTWGRRLLAGREHVLHKYLGCPMSDAGGINISQLSFRGGLRKESRAGWLDGSELVTDEDGEPLEVTEVEFIEDRLPDERELELELTHTFTGDEEAVKDILWKLAHLGEDSGWETAGLEIARDTRLRDRIVEAYQDRPTIPGVQRVDPSAAAQASLSEMDYQGIADEAMADILEQEILMSEDMIARDTRNGGNGIATYLQPEFPHDQREIDWVLDDVVGKEGFDWFEQEILNGKDLTPEFRDLNEAMHGLSPTEKAAVAKGMAWELNRRLKWGPNEETVFMEDRIIFPLMDIFAETMDIDDEDVQWHAGLPGLNLDYLDMPVDQATKRGWQTWEYQGFFGHPSTFFRVNDAIEEWSAPVGDFHAKDWKPWYTEVSRRAEMRVALSGRSSWNDASQAGIAAWRASKKPTRKQAPHAAAREFVVKKLLRSGLEGDSGRMTWQELLRGGATVLFKDKDGGQKLFAAILEKLPDDEAAQEWARRALQ